MNSIEVKNLTKSFGDFTLKDLSFNVPSGTIMGLVGENGAGKSTAIKELGKLGIAGQEISKGAFATGGYGKWEKLKPQTVKRKGSSDILIDKSKLVNSIHNWIVDK